MGAGRIHNDLADAVQLAGAASTFETDPNIKRAPETGDPIDFIQVAVFWTSIAAVARAALPPLKDAMIAWLKMRSDREIEVSIGKHKVRIRGENDVDKAISSLEKLIEIGAGRIDEEE